MTRDRRIFDGKPYVLEQSIFFPADHLGKLYCECGSDQFEVIYTDIYETTAECAKCGRSEVVHGG